MANQSTRRQWWNPIWVWQTLVRAILFKIWCWILAGFLKTYWPWLITAMIGALAWLGRGFGLPSEWANAGGIAFLFCSFAALFAWLVNRNKPQQPGGVAATAVQMEMPTAALQVSPPNELLVSDAQKEKAHRERIRVFAVLNKLPDSDLRLLNAIAKEGPQSVFMAELTRPNLFYAQLIVSLGPSGLMGESMVDLHPDAREAIIEYVVRHWPRPRDPSDD
ncbi:MAG TPA: hypothetical protein VHQ90_13360 [Thermoanaerobaculia bacterium]|nr:hypothetical protein [Thermoanaerobaculia bacterium]